MTRVTKILQICLICVTLWGCHTVLKNKVEGIVYKTDSRDTADLVQFGGVDDGYAYEVDIKSTSDIEMNYASDTFTIYKKGKAYAATKGTLEADYPGLVKPGYEVRVFYRVPRSLEATIKQADSLKLATTGRTFTFYRVTNAEN